MDQIVNNSRSTLKFYFRLTLKFSRILRTMKICNLKFLEFFFFEKWDNFLENAFWKMILFSKKKKKVNIETNEALIIKKFKG